MSQGPLPEADLDWRGRADIVSRVFDDVYFSREDGVAEAAHVFLGGNDLRARFAQLAPGASFSVGELGFGSGLNILCLWKLFEEVAPPGSRLVIQSVEGYPLSQAAFARIQDEIAARWPVLADRARRLAALYPLASAGRHQLDLSDRVQLILCFDEVETALAHASWPVVAWFLDGFSPARNPAMWSGAVMRSVARLSAPGATLATFTVAGAVRRALQAAGFVVEKRPGFGRKRDMLAGYLDNLPEPALPPWLDPAYGPGAAVAGQRVAVIGAGIAGAALAHALRDRGYTVTLWDQRGPAAGASGNPAGLIMPRLDLDDTPAARFYRQAFLQTVRLLDQLTENGATVWLSRDSAQLALSDADSARHDRLLAAPPLPPEELGQADRAEDLTHLRFPTGGVVDPVAFVRALLGAGDVHRGALRTLRREADEWQMVLATPEGERTDSADIVILANGPDAALFTSEALSLAGSVGQIDLFDTPPPDHALAFGAYAAPYGRKTIGGATYDPLTPDSDLEWCPERARRNFEALQQVLPTLRSDHIVPNGGRVAVRAVTPDRHPVAGPVPDRAAWYDAYAGLGQGHKGPYPAPVWQPGLYALTGLGSRGLVTAPLLAAHLVSVLNGASSPLGQKGADLVHPGRFLIRALKRRKD